MRIQWSDLKTFDIIGSGSFGRVFHGDLLGTEVAIKECVRSNSKAFDEKYFKREVDILKQSRHPNIVQFMGICKRKKRFYIVTEFLPLGNLRRWIQDDTKEFGWDTRISFAIDISLALAYLHHKNIIHRDLKGENLLISENMRVKVCDFGFSREEAKDDDEMRRISYCGTDGYMAPEILLGEDFDCSVDVFSFGVVLAEMMARHVVDTQHFQRISPDMRLSSDEILFRAQLGCPLELGELAIHCVQPLPQHRPKLKEVVERLTAIENVDIHVGTTLVVAPSVARAARNMMRAKNANQHGNFNTELINDGESVQSSAIESSVIGSTSTYKGNPWRGDLAQRLQSESSVFPLVNGNQHTATDGNKATSSSELEDSNDEDITFRMPLWDSINSPDNQNQLRKWHESPSYRVDIIEGENHILSWDQERNQTRSEHDLANLSSIHCNLSDGDNSGSESSYSIEDSDVDDRDDEYMNSLLDESDDETVDKTLGRIIEEYELSSDSDESFSSNSLTDSVVVALDTLEIPDTLLAKLPMKNIPLEIPPHISQTVVEIEPSDAKISGVETNPFRKPNLISRLLPPIPDSENPWAIYSDSQDMNPKDGQESIRPADDSTNRATTVKVSLSQAEASQIQAYDSLSPPALPSKSSFFLRTNIAMSLRQPSQGNTLTQHDIQNQPLESLKVTEYPSLDSTSNPQSSSSSSLSPSSSHSDEIQCDNSSPAENKDDRAYIKGQGLIRGMSDSAIESASNAIGAGGTMAGNFIAAMGAKTWTSGTGGIGLWIGHGVQYNDKPEKTGLKKHTSLKEGKQQRDLANQLSRRDELSIGESEDEEPVSNEAGFLDFPATVNRRARNPTTGFSHRFSLVVFSTQLLPRCDVCQKRLGVLPGWATKHLQCDDCGYKAHSKCVSSVVKCCTSARKSGVWEIPV
ncbi:hypothetical protein BGZ76_005628 [Entomortierella beljakovae]|nr:hypothetical protein BGZ76_005628 [Entomortierella beljakovae]